MGFWDRFRTGKRKGPPAVQGTPSSEPAARTTADGVAISLRLGDADRPVQPPARRGQPEVRQVSLPATITAFHLPAETGALETAEGTRLEFGRSACKGFEPVAGARVVVEAIAAYPEGGARDAGAARSGWLRVRCPRRGHRPWQSSDHAARADPVPGRRVCADPERAGACLVRPQPAGHAGGSLARAAVPDLMPARCGSRASAAAVFGRRPGRCQRCRCRPCGPTRSRCRCRASCRS